MTKLIVSGCNGYMGHVLTAEAGGDPDVKIIAGFDIDVRQTVNYPIFESPANLLGSADAGRYVPDAVVDFSLPRALGGLLEYGASQNVPLVLCTTGYSAEQIEAIEKASRSVPILCSANMSVGINLLVDLIKRACSALGEDFDVEIVERHHKRKADAPSGTALLLADAVGGAMPTKPDYVYERASSNKPREANTIGISSVRGGSIVGEHDVIFAGHDEIIEIKHTAMSRDIFAVGALKAAKWITGKPPGLYSMRDVLGN